MTRIRVIRPTQVRRTVLDKGLLQVADMNICVKQRVHLRAGAAGRMLLMIVLLLAIQPPGAAIGQADEPAAALADPVITSSPFQQGVTLTDQTVGAHSVKTADLDRDGRLDVVIASREDGAITWLRNLGGLQFERHTVATAAGSYVALPADLNRDGRVDIVVAAVGALNPSSRDGDGESAAAGAGAIFWLRNNLPNSPAFIRQDIATGLNYPVAVHVADLDGDGDPDVAGATRDDGRITWYENAGGANPWFGAHPVAADMPSAVAVHAGDFDADGYLDLVGASEDTNRIFWYRNNGARPPTFEARTIRNGPAPPGNMDYAKSVFAADIDGDGDMDVAFVSEQQNQVGWYENQGRGAQFSERILATNADHAKAVIVADIDSDGDADILAASSVDNKVLLFENTRGAPANFTGRIVTNSARGARAVHAADIDGDGDIDLFSASRDDNRITLYVNQTTHRTALLTSQQESILSVQRSARAVWTADIDNDGRRDILSVSLNQVSWYRNEGGQPPRFTQYTVANNLEAGRWIAAGDLDGDGDQDLMVADTRANNIWWYENLLTQPGALPNFAARLVTGLTEDPRTILPGDLDGDGDLDLYSSSNGDNSVYWYENNGRRPPQFVRRLVSNQAYYARSAYAADLDGDGDLDLMSASANDHEITWYENRGGLPPVFTERLVADRMWGARHIHAEDIDMDGDIDILSALELNNTIAWHENRGGAPPTFVTRALTQQAWGVHAIYTADIDMDGDPDVVAANETGNAIAWYENLGAPTWNFVEHLISTNNRVAHGVYADDLDADGDIDVLAASREDGKIAWYENLGGQFALAESRPGATTASGAVLLDMAVTHKGRSGNAALRLNALNLRFTNFVGQPLTTEQLAAQINRILVYRNQGSASFSPTEDQLLVNWGALTLNGAGDMLVPLTSPLGNTQTVAGATDHYFVVAESSVGGCFRPDDLRVSVIPDGLTVRNATTDYPMIGELMRSIDTTIEVGFQPRIVINEILADADRGYLDPNEPEEYPDWIELYNPSFLPINLNGMYLTDDPADPRKFRIAIDLIVQPYSYVVFIADGEPEQGPLHTNFRLSRAGEYVAIHAGEADDFRTIDSVEFDALLTNQSFGRDPSGGVEWRVLGTPTPGGANLRHVVVATAYLPFIGKMSGCR
jgi:hypothetical protein